jgi:muramoyltetrapeptide carboxypeptidase
MKQPKALKPGDTIGVAAPASPFDRGEFKRGVHALEKLGFGVHYRKDIFDQNRYLAGTDDRRAEELASLFANPKIKAIMFARGGYGSQRVIPLLDDEAISAHPKPVVGFSDITALLNHLRQRCGVPTFYGPVLTMLGRNAEGITAQQLAASLTASEPLGVLPCGDARTLREGEATGPIVGGCLSLICSSMGTPYELDADGAILFIEETGEKIYVLDRMLTQLKNAGMFAAARGIVVGSIVQHEGEEQDLQSMLGDVLGSFDGPVVTDFPAGHSHPFVTLPLGLSATLKASAESKPTLEITQRTFS